MVWWVGGWLEISQIDGESIQTVRRVNPVELSVKMTGVVKVGSSSGGVGELGGLRLERNVDKLKVADAGIPREEVR